MYNLFKENSMPLKTHKYDIILADDINHSRETLLAIVPVTIEGRAFEPEFIILPEARDDRTLLDINFLKKAKIVLAVSKKSLVL
ncbi:hypothetical protein CEXT_589741 [Caerostris extrusa]|uniref:Uncharacterized protein n=1 Tax=Caerostris extrusa TaxID=172846 RepID=A0AAV4P1P2_CAEEX|nr:hypothetical protein CEXT_589741 [Caerostris extrusa]